MSFFINNWMLELIIVLSGAMLVWPLLQGRFSKMKEVGTLHATQLINRSNAVLLDVRAANEFAAGHLPNAVNIPLAELGNRAWNSRSSRATRHRLLRPGPTQPGRGSALAKLGFADVYLLTGGIKAWKDAGLPVQK